VDDLHKMEYMIESNPDDVWELLNKRCHEKFGSKRILKNQPN
jgi:hypothetical protein